MINMNEVIIRKVRNWLDDNQKSIQWLAKEIGVSKSLMGHILTGERQFLPERIVQVANVMGIKTEELLAPELEEKKPYTLQLRGKANSRVAKRHIKNMLFAIEDCLRIEEANSYQGESNNE